MFDIFENRLVVRGVITLQTGLHVGTQPSVDPVGSDLPVVRGRRGQPFIPGSSLKGVLRQSAERLLRGIGADACEPFPDRSCLKDIPERRRKLRDERKDDETVDQEMDEEIERGICDACRVFGATERAGKLLVRDSLLHGEAPKVEVRDGVGIDRDTGTAADGVKYDFEVVPHGTRFNLELVLENAEPWERGLVFVVLDELNRGHTQLGGMTSRGLGRVGVGYEVIEEWDADAVVASTPRASYPGPLAPQPAVPPEGPAEEAPEISALREILAPGFALPRGVVVNHLADRGLTKTKLVAAGRYGPERKLWDNLFKQAQDVGVLVVERGHMKKAPPKLAPAAAPNQPAAPSEAEKFVATARTALRDWLRSRPKKGAA